MPPEHEPVQTVSRSSQWRVIFSNIIGITFSDEFRLHFGFDQDLSQPGRDVLEEATVVMSPRSAKFLSHTLGAAVSRYEEINGPITGVDESIRKFEAAQRPKDKGKNR
jgi:hypothetical protein